MEIILLIVIFAIGIGWNMYLHSDEKYGKNYRRDNVCTDDPGYLDKLKSISRLSEKQQGQVKSIQKSNMCHFHDDTNHLESDLSGSSFIPDSSLDKTNDTIYRRKKKISKEIPSPVYKFPFVSVISIFVLGIFSLIVEPVNEDSIWLYTCFMILGVIFVIPELRFRHDLRSKLGEEIEKVVDKLEDVKKENDILLEKNQRIYQRNQELLEQYDIEYRRKLKAEYDEIIKLYNGKIQEMLNNRNDSAHF